VVGSPAVSVVVASHARPLRLRWLLNALEEQAFGEPWELIVVHDYDPGTARRVIDQHPLAQAGRLGHVAIEPGTGSPARQRNIGWRAARAPYVAYVDDDCRPEPDWLERLMARAAGPNVVVQGATRPDPLEAAAFAAPHARSLTIEPVNRYVQTCNILYPRALLEQLKGFDERAVVGEDVDLALRARAAGARIEPAADAVAYHAWETPSLPRIIRQNMRWRYLAYLVKQHPEFREQLPLRVFWDEEHLRTGAAIAGLAGARLRSPLAVLALPYVANALARRGRHTRGRLIAAIELPGQFVRQAAELGAHVAGSIQNRTLLL